MRLPVAGRYQNSCWVFEPNDKLDCDVVWELLTPNIDFPSIQHLAKNSDWREIPQYAVGWMLGGAQQVALECRTVQGP